MKIKQKYLEENPDHEERLNKFVNYLRQMPEVIGVIYFGSTATKKWHEYSDLDIDVVVEDKNYKKFLKKIPKFLSWWGKVKLINHYEGRDEWYAFVNDDYLKIEIDPHRKSDIKPSYWFKSNRIVYDRNDFLKRIQKKSQKLTKPKADHKEFVRLFLDLRNTFIYAVRHYARGKKLSAIAELGNIGGQLFVYLGKIKGLEDWEHIRIADEILTKKEWDFLKTTRCKSLNKLEFKRTLKTTWQYMKYIEGLYEKTHKKKIKLESHDKEILNLIEDTLK